MLKKRSTGKIGNYIFFYTVCIIFTLIIIVPIVVAVMGGFKSQGQLRTDPFGLPSPLHPENYINIIIDPAYNFWRFMGNSIFILICTLVIDISLSIMAAYALSWIPFKGNKLVFTYFLIGYLFPGAVAMLPLYLLMKLLNLLDTHWSVIFAQAGFGLPWHIMLLRGFFVTIPRDLHDACIMDGAGPIRFLITIVIPLSTPVVATTGILTMVQSWNNYFLPLMFLNPQNLYTLPLGIYQFMGQYQQYWNQIMAFLCLGMVPTLIFYIFAQKYIVAGLTGGSIKG
ncbi:MAG: carbohydrate ABC transporter permease [Spirochaetales bacterium]|nr:carbohydrate ABC transporter permease [Spirochaetales bacterium]